MMCVGETATIVRSKELAGIFIQYMHRSWPIPFLAVLYAGCERYLVYHIYAHQCQPGISAGARCGGCVAGVFASEQPADVRCGQKS